MRADQRRKSGIRRIEQRSDVFRKRTPVYTSVKKGYTLEGHRSTVVLEKHSGPATTSNVAGKRHPTAALARE